MENTTEIDLSQGSQWRKWDLHIHTPASGFGIEGDYDILIEKLTKSEADVIGINDYGTIEGYEKILERGGVPGKMLFPVVEFRMSNEIKHKRKPTVKSGTNINFHLIFDNQLSPRKINTELDALKCLYQGGKQSKLGHVALEDRKMVMLDYFEVLRELRNSELTGRFLVWLPYDEYGGIDNIDPKNDSFFKMGLIREADFLGSANPKQISYFLGSESLQYFGHPIPCLKGSDAHTLDYPFGRLKDSNSNPIEKYCWIKADPTFEGLRQVVREPAARIFIGKRPDILDRLDAHKTRFIKRVKVFRAWGSVLNEIWFDDIDIELNPELVAIIGNKGNGKSALADIIGLLGNSHNYEYFSFLRKERFLKGPEQKAGHFYATMELVSGDNWRFNLLKQTDTHLSERVKYLPQSFLENLCNEDDQMFQQEIKKIIFQHLKEEEKLRKRSLDELIEFKNGHLEKEMQNLRAAINDLNIEIIQLERAKTPNHIETIRDQLKLKEQELAAHLLNEPDEVEKPITFEGREAEALSELKLKRQQLVEKVNESKERLAVLKIRKEKIQQLHGNFSSLFGTYKLLKEHEAEFIRTELGLEFEEVINVEFKHDLLNEQQDKADNEIAAINSLLAGDNPDGVYAALNKVDEDIAKLEWKVDFSVREYNDYLKRKQKWHEEKSAMEGSPDQHDTIQYYKALLDYIEKRLNEDLANKRSEREEKVSRLFALKNSILLNYKALYRPITEFVEQTEKLGDNYQVSFDATLKLVNFPERFLRFINNNKKGSFYGVDNSWELIGKMVNDTDFNEEQSLLRFLRAVLEALEQDQRPGFDNEPRVIEDQIINNRYLDLYNFIYGLTYLSPNYEIKLGGKSISQLSPGEKGALLLIFYLLLDKSDIPLIIDQPEENLDNQSVTEIVVPFIREAKKNRQIIIVTHNPNLAVVCDAEQVINVSLDKKDKNKFSFVSGSIENPEINQRIVDILEGTMPAFNVRDRKYEQSKRNFFV